MTPADPEPVARLLSHPAFAALRGVLGASAVTADDLSALQSALDARAVANARGARLRAEATVAPGAASYERGVLEQATLSVRPETWHDRFNVAAWCLFPHAKAALNAAHVDDLDVSPGPGRSRRRDALTLFDEDGVVVAITDPALECAIRGFRWHEAFVERRDALESRAACVPFGHAMLEKLLDPFPSLTGKAVFVSVPEAFHAWPWTERLACLDGAVSRIIGTLRTPRDLAPLPVLGWPGWHPDNADPLFYGNVQVFRPGRATRAR